MHKTILTLLLSALATSLTAAPPEGGKGKPGGDRRGPPPQIIEKFDKDGDGKLNEEEKQAAKAEMDKRRDEAIKKFDKDGDGKLNEAERLEAFKARLAENPKMKEMLLKKFDADKNGELSDAEIAQAAKQGPRGGDKGPGKGPRGPEKGDKGPGKDGKKPEGKRGEDKK